MIIFLRSKFFAVARWLQTFYTRWLADMVSVTQTQLSPIVTAENKESASFWNYKEDKAIQAKTEEHI